MYSCTQFTQYFMWMISKAITQNRLFTSWTQMASLFKLYCNINDDEDDGDDDDDDYDDTPTCKVSLMETNRISLTHSLVAFYEKILRLQGHT